MPAKITIYKDKSDEFRMKILANNNKNIGNLGEGYKTHSGVVNAVERLKNYMPGAKVVDKTK